MTSRARPHLGTASVEMSDSALFTPRVRRLVAISTVALGLITLLVATRAGSHNEPSLLLAAIGWLLMPVILTISLRRPRWRYLLAIPATTVAIALIVVSIQFTDGLMTTVGWWMMTSGILIGGTLGMWFWYRWLPVPGSLDDPFSFGRWSLIAAHVGLVAVGGLLVVL